MRHLIWYKLSYWIVVILYYNWASKSLYLHFVFMVHGHFYGKWLFSWALLLSHSGQSMLRGDIFYPFCSQDVCGVEWVVLQQARKGQVPLWLWQGSLEARLCQDTGQFHHMLEGTPREGSQVEVSQVFLWHVADIEMVYFIWSSIHFQIKINGLCEIPVFNGPLS